jgi:hypothetical protein
MGVTTAQDLSIELGPPLRVHHKEDERMTIHSAKQEQTLSAAGCNYSSLLKASIL